LRGKKVLIRKRLYSFAHLFPVVELKRGCLLRMDILLRRLNPKDLSKLKKGLSHRL